MDVNTTSDLYGGVAEDAREFSVMLVSLLRSATSALVAGVMIGVIVAAVVSYLWRGEADSPVPVCMAYTCGFPVYSLCALTCLGPATGSVVAASYAPLALGAVTLGIGYVVAAVGLTGLRYTRALDARRKRRMVRMSSEVLGGGLNE